MLLQLLLLFQAPALSDLPLGRISTTALSVFLSAGLLLSLGSPDSSDVLFMGYNSEHSDCSMPDAIIDIVAHFPTSPDVIQEERNPVIEDH